MTLGLSWGDVSQMEKIVRRSVAVLCWMPQYPPAGSPGCQFAPQ